MPIAYQAHFDGEKIQLDEPATLPKGAKLLVTVVAGEDEEALRRAWSEQSKRSLSRAYGDDEPEYSREDCL